MALQSKAFLEVLFANGARPDQDAFRGIFDSFLHKTEDVNFDDTSAGLALGGGITVGDADDGLPDGTIRFRSNQFEFKYNGNWEPLGTGSGGAFAPLQPTDPNVAYNGGNVGINVAQSPQYRLEVELAQNTSAGDPGNQVRMGQAVITRGSGTRANMAIFAHQNHAVNNNFALSQDVSGETMLHAPTDPAGQGFSRILIKQGTLSRNSSIACTTSGNVVINSDNEVTGSSGQAFQVSGAAFKTDGRTAWDVPSDARLKEDIRPFQDGLNLLRQVQPVQFRYNGKAGTIKDKECVGVVAQDMSRIFPYMVEQSKNAIPDENGADSGVLNFNPSSLTYVMLNAIKELAAKVEDLQSQLKDA